MKLCMVVLAFLLVSVSAEARPEYTFETEHLDVLSKFKASREAPMKSFIAKRSEGSPPSDAQNGSFIVDNHLYYASKYSEDTDEFQMYWRNLASLFETDDQVSLSPLSNRTRIIRTYKLEFLFPYYGHLVEYIGVATNGFIYTGTLQHSQVHNYQYIAPLQANFDPQLNSTANIYTLSTEDSFVVQWDNIVNLDTIQDGAFTFQLSLFQNGSIVFLYQEIPVPVNSINGTSHPLRIGIADAYFWLHFVFGGFLYGNIIRYHSVDLLPRNVVSQSSIILTPLPNCISAKTCLDCADMSKLSDFDCGWCPSLNRCSDGVDRHRQAWVASGCSDNASLSCLGVPTTVVIPTVAATFQGHPPPTMSAILPHPPQVVIPTVAAAAAGQVAGITVGVIVLLVVLVVLVIAAGVILLVVYGYRHPGTRLGMYMIQHHPFKKRGDVSASYDITKESDILEEYEEQ